MFLYLLLVMSSFSSASDPKSTGPVVIDREVVHGMTDWRRFGRAPDFTAKIKDVIATKVLGRGARGSELGGLLLFSG